MNSINSQLVKQCLLELSNRADQLRLWKSTGLPEVSSFVEAIEQLYTDSGLSGLLYTGKTGFGKQSEMALIELHKASKLVNADLNPDTLIASVAMENVRQLASKALVSLQSI